MMAKKYDHLFSKALMDIRFGEEPSLVGLLPHKVDKPITFKEIAEGYLLASDAPDRRKKELSKYIDILSQLITNTVNQSVLDNVRQTIKTLPKGTIKKYRGLSISQIKKLEIPEEDYISVKTANEYIKVLNSILQYGYEREYFNKIYKLKLIVQETTARNQREALDRDTLMNLLEGARKKELRSAYTILYLTGMRLSEAYKVKLSTIDSILCFDLTDRSIPLKTQSSYRLIPVHNSIKDKVYEMLEDLRSLKPDYISKQAKLALGNKDKVSLYSLRHTFATDLIHRGALPEVVSELMGHSHNTMTMGRYSKGYNVEQLKDTIELLSFNCNGKYSTE